MIWMLLFSCLLWGYASAAFRAKAVMEIKEKFWEDNKIIADNGASLLSVRNNGQTCTNGFVTIDNQDYPCDKVDFLSLISRSELRRTRPDFTDTRFQMSDIWGWKSPNGREFTLACMTNVLWFIDSTDPLEPRPVAYIESHRSEAFWCDVKVYKDVAYIVQDRLASGGNDRGIQVVDLTRLESSQVFNAASPPVILPDFTYAEHGAVHNVVIDVDSGFLFNVGTNGGNDCAGGLHIVDLNSNKLEPTFVACAAQDGYTHDAQCIVYTGPDTEFTGREICFGYNEDEVTIYDVTDKNNIQIVGKASYPTATYVHQGWLSPDQGFLITNDELDEERNVVGNTRSYVMDVTSLRNPQFSGSFTHPVSSVDHNMYFWGEMYFRGWTGSGKLENPPNRNFVYCSNYASGLRVLDATGISENPPNIEQIGFFDIAPDINGNQFFGAWSSYMHPSGVIAVTGIESGVFFLNFTQAFEASVVTDDEGGFLDSEFLLIGAVGGVAVLFVVLMVLAVGSKSRRGRKGKRNTNTGLSTNPAVKPWQGASVNQQFSNNGFSGAFAPRQQSNNPKFYGY